MGEELTRKNTAAHWVLQVLGICTLVQMAISWKVWLWISVSDNFFRIPFFSFIPNPGHLLYTTLSIVLIACMVWLVLHPQKRGIVITVFVLSLLQCMQNVYCLQPWMYLWMLALLLHLSTLRDVSGEALLRRLRIAFALLYFWSGVQKLNVAFAEEVFPFFLHPLGGYEWGQANLWAGWSTAALEAAAGLLLLLPLLRIYAALALMLLHVLAFIFIGPFGQTVNAVVWPWNLALPVVIALLFWKKEVAPAVQLPVFHLSHIVITLAFVLLPALNFFQGWDDALSFHLYSGATREGIFYCEEKDRKQLVDKDLGHVYFIEGTNEEFFQLDAWAMDELKVPFYTEVRSYAAWGRCLCEKLEEPSHAGIRVMQRKRFTSEQSLIEFTCAELMK